MAAQRMPCYEMKESRDIKIAIVDDDEIAGSALRRMVASLGDIPVDFSSGEAFLGAPDKQTFLCVIVGLHKSVLNRIALLGRMRREMPRYRRSSSQARVSQECGSDASILARQPS